VILIGLHDVAFVIMIGLHIRDLFCSSLVVELDADAVADGSLYTGVDAGVVVLAAELGVMIVVFVAADVGVFVDVGVLVAGVFCKNHASGVHACTHTTNLVQMLTKLNKIVFSFLCQLSM